MSSETADKTSTFLESDHPTDGAQCDHRFRNNHTFNHDQRCIYCGIRRNDVVAEMVAAIYKAATPAHLRHGLVPGRSVGLRSWFVRLWCYLFVRRLAIKPSSSIHYDPSGATEHFDETYRFEWQKMPKGWRWF